MKHQKLAIVLVLGSLLGTLGLSLIYEDWGCRGNRRPIRLAVDVWVGFAPLHLAQDKGFFNLHGVEVELRTMKGSEEIRAGLAAEELDGQTTSLDTILMQNDQGVPAVAVLALDRSDGGDGLVATSEVRTVAGLRGRSVAFQPATPSQFFLMYHLDRAGMTLDDIKAQKMDSGDAGAAFVAGHVDAAVTWEPWLSQALAKEDSRLLASTRGEPAVIVDVLAFRPSVLRDRPDEVRSIVAAWDHAVLWWREHPEEANRLMAAHYGLDVNEFTEMLRGLRYLTQKDNRDLIGTLEQPGALVDLVGIINKVFLRSQIIRSPRALNEILAFDFL